MDRPGRYFGLAAIVWCSFLLVGESNAQTVVRSISQSSDDAEQYVSDGEMYLNSSDLELRDEDGTDEQHIGMRFQNITVPVGATITSATIQFHVDEVTSNTAVTLTFTGEDTDDASTFTTSSNNIGSRTQTSASVSWAAPHWASVSDEGAAQQTDDLSSIIQEIVDRGGWISGNDIVIMIRSHSGSGFRNAESYDGESANAPEITITYSTDSTPPSAPVITQPASPTTDSTPVISGTASEDGGTITLTSDVDGVLSPTGTVTGGNWSITLTSALTNGSHALTATHTDAATNESSASGAKYIDVSAPLVVAVAASSDDAEEEISSGSVVLTGNVLEHIDSSGTLEQQMIGMRFQNITIPSGAVIDQANIQYNVINVDADVAITVTYVGEDIDDAPTFTTTNSSISGRTQTTASVDWSPAHWENVSDEGAAQKTPDLSTIIQEIVDRAGWSSGNDIVIIVKPSSGSGRRQPRSYNNSASAAPELTIVYGSEPVEYRSKATGNWSSPSTWERKMNGSWGDAPDFPLETDSTITILSGHTVTVDSGVGGSLTVDDLTVASGATLIIDHATNLDDGPGTDLTVAGQVTVNAGDTFNTNSGATMSVSSGGQVTNGGSITTSGSTTTTFTSGSTYVHARDGGNFPDAATTTWSSGSTVNVTGVTTTAPGQLGDSFHHFIWNSASQTGAVNLAGAVTGVAGNLTVTSTGSGSLQWLNAGAFTLGGDLVQSGGDFHLTNGTANMYVGGLTLTGGTLTTTTGTTGLLWASGNVEISGTGTLTEAGSAASGLYLNGSGSQSLTVTGSITNDVGILTTNSGTGVVLQSNLDAPYSLTASSSDFDANGYDISVGDELVISGTGNLLNPAKVTLDGSGTHTLSSANALTIPHLVVDRSGGGVTLGSNLTISTTACVEAGTLTTTGYTLTFATGATLLSSGTITGNVTLERTYNLVQDGWRMIASPLDGIAYSDLNGNFHTQGAPWADQTGGSATLQSPDFAAQDWTEITGADADFTAAEGYIFYMYDELLGSTILPATWGVTGTVRSNIARSLSWNTVSTDSYNYVGNRTTSNIDWDAAYTASTNVASTYSTWDPALTSGGGLTGYKYYNQATGTGLAGRYIPPFTAFMVEPTAASGSFVFSTSKAANLATANYFGKRGSNGDQEREPSPFVRFAVEGEGLADLETYLVFDEAATDGEDPFDGRKMRPLAVDHVSLVSIEGGRNLVFDGRPIFSGVQTYTLGIGATKPGRYTLTWPDLHGIPSEWSVTLSDLTDGRQVDLRTSDSLVFAIHQPSISGKGGHAGLDVAARFKVEVKTTGGGYPTLELPVKLILAQNYPNPFNPTTSIRFGLSEDSSVRVEVFDLLGRRVGLLVDESRSAGWHEVRWDAGRRPSGMYLYRIVANGHHLTRSMTLLR